MVIDILQLQLGDISVDIDLERDVVVFLVDFNFSISSNGECQEGIVCSGFLEKSVVVINILKVDFKLRTFIKMGIFVFIMIMKKEGFGEVIDKIEVVVISCQGLENEIVKEISSVFSSQVGIRF